MQKIIDEKKEKAWEMYQNREIVSQIAKRLNLSYSSAWAFTEGRKRGYKSYEDYQAHLVQQKGYKSFSEYLKHCAEERRKRIENQELSMLIKTGLRNVGKNQTWLAGKIGRNKRTVSSYTLGKEIPSREDLRKILSALEIRTIPKVVELMLEKLVY
jgi:hypothetical protein